MFWIGLILVLLLIYIGIDYGRLMAKAWRQQTQIDFEPYTPVRYIMIASEHAKHMMELYMLDVNAHSEAGINVKVSIAQEGYSKIIFDNNDELIMYFYDKAPIDRLTQKEIDNYSHRVFFDYRLPEGAERAIIKQLGLLDYMVNIGICSEKSGGK